MKSALKEEKKTFSVLIRVNSIYQFAVFNALFI